MKLLIFGDVVGKLGRAGVKHMLPIWREKFSPDVVVANVENILHGKGIGIKQINELKEAGVNIFTGGNHSVEGKDFAQILNDETAAITRPANMRKDLPGRGAIVYDVKKKEVFTSEHFSDRVGASEPTKRGLSASEMENANEVKLLTINLIGQVFMHQEYSSPFEAIDKILAEHSDKTPFKILDWHADATSEKSVMGWYLDGKVSAVFGTHTHVPTADAKILPNGTAFITDIGMTGAYNSVIGVEINPSIERFKFNKKTPKNPVDSGPIEVNAIYLELGENGKAVDIRHLREIIPEDKIVA